MTELKGKNSCFHLTNKKIGKGAFSQVYKGLDLESDKIVAIKIIDKENISSKMKSRLGDEIKLHSNLNHPNIIKLFDIIEDEKYYYIILEYCSNGDLHNLIKKCREKNNSKLVLNENLTKIYIKQLADGLKYLRDKNIVHRDLKPHNILLFDEFTIKLTDFNFARELWDKDMAETLCGSPLYMAPEIIQYNSYSSKSDLWSVGMIIYEMLHGYTPFDDAINPMDLLHKIKRRKIEINNSVSYFCKDLIYGLLTIKSESRLDWKCFFEHKWLEENIDSDFDSSNSEVEEFTLFHTVAPKKVKNLTKFIIDDYVTTQEFHSLCNEETITVSKPIDIEIKTKNSNKVLNSPQSVPTNILHNTLNFMTSSVGSAMRGTFNYLSQ